MRTVISLTLLMAVMTGFGQNLSINTSKDFPCLSEEVEYTASWSSIVPGPGPCLTYTWSLIGGVIISGQGSNRITIRWTTTGTKTVNVSAESEISGGGGQLGTQHTPGSNDYDLSNSYEPTQECPSVSEQASKTVLVNDPGSGNLTGYANAYSICSGDQITLTASPTGDAVNGWIGWYDALGIKVSSGSSTTATVNQAGVYEARASIGSGNCSTTKTAQVTIESPATYPTGRLIGDRTVYEGVVTSGDIQLIDASTTPIEEWEVKIGNGGWETYQVTSSKTISYDQAFFDNTQFRAVIQKDCPEQSDQYSPTVTISSVEYIPDLNSIETIQYTTDETPVSKSIGYFDNAGKPMQSQSWDPTSNAVFATEPLYDEYDRRVGSTLQAHVRDGELKYKPDFITSGGDRYVHADWKSGTPNAVDDDEEYTLGRYYSEHNNDRVPSTNYPYTVSKFYEDGSGERMTSSVPGEVMHINSDKITRQKTFPVLDGELPFYADIRGVLLGQGNVPDRLVKQVIMDGNGHEIIAYTDEQGGSIASAISGGPEYINPITRVNDGTWVEVHIPKGQEQYFSSYEVVDLISENTITGNIGQGFYKMKASTGTLSYKPTYTNFTYNFYDVKGRLIASMTPKGTQQLFDQGGLGAITLPEELPYTTLYRYDFQGRLLEMTEPDAGLTEYKYRTDGQIRFSQNARQKEMGDHVYSYTNYDPLGRPIESGECTCVVSFDAADPNTDNAFDFGEGDPPARRDWIKTHYDIPVEFGDKEHGCEGSPNPCDPIIIEGFEYNDIQQEFISGAVSSTESDEVQSWYSYDEQGRVTWYLQHLKSMDKYFLIMYEYDFLGNVTKVAFQPQTYNVQGVVSEAFWHQYTYDASQRLQVVTTSVNDADYYEHARYEYFPHGPLKRIILAEDLQGIDYTYTAQGWLKAINHPIPSLDPGEDGDATNVSQDAFGMTLEYFEGDYSDGSASSIGSLNLTDAEIPQQYNGNIRAATFPGSGNSEYVLNTLDARINLTSYGKEEVTAREQITLKPGFSTAGNEFRANIASVELTSMSDASAYGYTYDEKYQLKKAKHGKATSNLHAEDDAYDVSMGDYDENGNISSITRHGEDPNTPRDQFTFTYAYNLDPSDEAYCACNRLVSVSGYIQNITYDEIGQVTGITYEQSAGRPDIQIVYDVTGKVTRVWDVTDPNTPEELIAFQYDDRGFRMSKKVGDIEEWYIRDASGQVMAIYHRDLGGESPNILAQIELPIYGSGKLGTAFKNPDHYKYIYELTDHLGNVRVLVTKLGIQATATMETDNSLDAYEEQFFDNMDASRHQDLANSYRGEHMAFTDQTQPLGPSATLRVRAGDEINLDVFVKYTEGGDPVVGPAALADLLDDHVNDAAVGVEGGGLSSAVTSNLAAVLGGVTSNSGETKAYLQYMLFDDDFNLVDSDYRPVQEGVQTPDHPDWKHLTLSGTVTEDGYLYAYLVNESDEAAYFDNFTFSVLGTRMIRSTDYYPFGAVAKVWNNPDQTQRETYRHGYQGQYAEQDTTTGWNAFELRMYDPLIGRFIQVDPASQFASPYNGMGNDPVRGYDPNGGICVPCLTSLIGGAINVGVNIATGDINGEVLAMAIPTPTKPSIWISGVSDVEFHKAGLTFMEGGMVGAVAPAASGLTLYEGTTLLFAAGTTANFEKQLLEQRAGYRENISYVEVIVSGIGAGSGRLASQGLKYLIGADGVLLETGLDAGLEALEPKVIEALPPELIEQLLEDTILDSPGNTSNKD